MNEMKEVGKNFFVSYLSRNVQKFLLSLKDIKKLMKLLEDEQRARRRTEEILRRVMLSQRNSTPKLQINGEDSRLASEESLSNNKR